MFKRPRIILAALRGGSGKTVLTLGLAAAWRKRGRRVAVFKKGPDFIDAGWLSFAAGIPCRNLDTFLMTESAVVRSFADNTREADISLIEGNRGLFDGLDVEGRCSTAELSKLLKTPVVLIVDVAMATRTVAALVVGCQRLDPELKLEGVILNRVAGSRQENLVRSAIEKYCGTPVVGAVPRLGGHTFPERHMGLVPRQEREQAERAIAWAMDAAEKHLDLDALWEIAVSSGPLVGYESGGALSCPVRTAGLRIGYILDRSFWFYYPENLEHLSRMGAALVKIDSLADRELPELDALYIGGGFPETQAEALSGNKTFRNSLRDQIEAGLPVYAECGGLIYMGESLVTGERTYPMVGALPIKFVFEKKPQGHGYTVVEVDGPNPFLPPGQVLKGHEFHYSRPVFTGPERPDTVFKLLRGRGLEGNRDGFCRHNLLATYTHLHAGGTRIWGEGLVRAAVEEKYHKTGDFLIGCGNEGLTTGKL